MKILVLSNLYPPHHIGGYGMLCYEVVEGLRSRGHQVTVLTSIHGVETETIEEHIYRVLTLESDLYFYKPAQAWLHPLAKRKNLNHLRRLITTVQPDIVFIWGMWNLSRCLALESEKLMGHRVVYYLASPWPIEPNIHQTYWDEPAQSLSRLLLKKTMQAPIRLLLRSEWQPVPLSFQHAPICSKAQRDQLLEAGVPLQDAPIIYEGIDLAPYLSQKTNGTDKGNILSLVYVGALVEHKGVHTIIEALPYLPQEKLEKVRLTILGKGHPHYESHLHNLVETHKLSKYVAFHSPIPRSELPEFLGRYEVLLLPSIWEEPLARIMQEGLATGLVVVGAATGGTKEIVSNGDNGLLFAAEDAPALAAHIKQLIDEPALRQNLAINGRNTAIKMFDMTRMIDDLENYLEQVHTSSSLP
jgi:glycosyltransferase involved in cell wall biosynthesis